MEYYKRMLKREIRSVSTWSLSFSSSIIWLKYDMLRFCSVSQSRWRVLTFSWSCSHCASSYTVVKKRQPPLDKRTQMLKMFCEGGPPCPSAPPCSAGPPGVWWWCHRVPASVLQTPCGPAAGCPSKPQVTNKKNTSSCQAAILNVFSDDRRLQRHTMTPPETFDSLLWVPLSTSLWTSSGSAGGDPLMPLGRKLSLFVGATFSWVSSFSAPVSLALSSSTWIQIKKDAFSEAAL